MKRSGPLKRTGRLKQRSAKARAQDRAREECRQQVFARSGGLCEVCPVVDPGAPAHRASEVHEVLMRSQGGSIIDPDNCLATCRRGHRLVHDYPARAYDLGLLRRSGGTRD